MLLGYGGVKGTPTSIIAIYNAQGVRCNNRTDFKCKLQLNKLATSPTPPSSETQSAWLPAPLLPASR